MTFVPVSSAAGHQTHVAIYSTFLQRAFDQIEHDVALQKLPVVFCLDRGGLVGDDGATHHGVFDLSYLRMIPNLAVMSPKDEGTNCSTCSRRRSITGKARWRSVTRAATARAWRSTHPSIFSHGGKGEVVKDGNDLAVLAIGNMVLPSLAAANALAQQSGPNVKVINARFVKPLDRAWLLEQLKGIRMVVTVEENVLAGGFGSGIRELLEGTGIDVRSIGIPDRFIEHGTQPQLRNLVGLTEEKIAESLRVFYAAIGHLTH